MPDPPFDAPGWLRALTLAERADLLRGDPQAAPGRPGRDVEGARQRLLRWKIQSPFSEDEWLSRRLHTAGLSEESFTHLLGTPPDHLRDLLHEPPRWLAILAETYGTPGTTAGGPAGMGEPAEMDPSLGFLRLVRPLMNGARARLRSALERVVADDGEAPCDLSSEKLLSVFLPERLLPILDRTLVLELNVARIQGILEGKTPEDRFRDFVGRLGRREIALSLFSEYPVLARRVAEETERWAAASMEFLERLCADWPLLRAAFFPESHPGCLAELRANAGDPHHAGRSVIVAVFASGRKIVYKPRSLLVDIHFNEFLAWVNQRGDHPAFRTLKVLDRGEYGWVEFAEAAPCASEEGIRRYHRRLGGLLAVLYVLEATDFHYENLIAAGDQPILIDLESILHPRAPRPEPDRPDERLAGRLLSQSVVRVGLLPFRIGDNEEFEGIDLSGVSSVRGQITPERLLQWEQMGTDEMRAVRERMPMTGGSNRPVLDGREAEAADYIPDVEAGFADLYQKILRHRDEISSPDGPLSRFAGDPVRAVLRPTRAYGLIAEESLHPDFLRDALDRDLFLDRLWVGLDRHPALARVVADEHRDLWAGDIPYFVSRPGSTDLWTSRGEPIAGFFEEPALDTVRRRLREMDETDLRRQSWLVRVTLSTRILNRDSLEWPGYTPVSTPADSGGEPLRARLIEAARRAGDRLDLMAVEDSSDVTWIGLDYRNKTWSLAPMSEDLYAGVPGIALFLGYLGAITGEDRYGALARKAVGTLLRRLRSGAEGISCIGAFQGWGGILYVLAHLGALWRDPDLIEEGERVADRIAAMAPRDDDLDVIAGAAGGIGACLALNAAAGSTHALPAARQCGERLLEVSREARGGLCWLTRIGGDQPQTGFSHGVAGIGMALADLAAATGDARYREAALAGFEFERQEFWPEIRKWLDEGGGPARGERNAPPEKHVAMAWCHGAPGVGFSRLRALRHLERRSLEAELDSAIRLTAERGFGKNHCLCHGDLGNLDFLTQGFARSGGGDLGKEVLRRTHEVLGSIARDGWLCGTQAGVESPGLMNGLAGIGYGLLRLAAPERVPSVLVMEPPASILEESLSP